MADPSLFLLHTVNVATSVCAWGLVTQSLASPGSLGMSPLSDRDCGHGWKDLEGQECGVYESGAEITCWQRTVEMTDSVKL